MTNSSVKRNRCSHLNFIKKRAFVYSSTCQLLLSNWTMCSAYRVVSSWRSFTGHHRKKQWSNTKFKKIPKSRKISKNWSHFHTMQEYTRIMEWKLWFCLILRNGFLLTFPVISVIKHARHNCYFFRLIFTFLS